MIETETDTEQDQEQEQERERENEKSSDCSDLRFPQLTAQSALLC